MLKPITKTFIESKMAKFYEQHPEYRKEMENRGFDGKRIVKVKKA